MPRRLMLALAAASILATALAPLAAAAAERNECGTVSGPGVCVRDSGEPGCGSNHVIVASPAAYAQLYGSRCAPYGGTIVLIAATPAASITILWPGACLIVYVGTPAGIVPAAYCGTSGPPPLPWGFLP